MSLTEKNYINPNEKPNSSTWRAALFSLTLFISFMALTSYLAFWNNNKKPTVSQSANVASSINAPAQVNITNKGFVPASITIQIGQAVIWTNNDVSQHSVISDDPLPTNSSMPSVNSSLPLSQNDSFSYIFNARGTFSYHDDQGPNFTGSIIVK